MADQARRGIVEVSGPAPVLIVRVAPGVTGQTRERFVVVRIGVASRAGIAGVSSGGDRKPGVAEYGPVPIGIRGAVAGIAGRRISCRAVIWIAGPIVVGPMAAVTISGRALIDVVDVTDIAGDGGMNADERIGGGVIEPGPVPVGVRGLVTTIADRRIARCGVVGIPGLIVSGLMTAETFALGPFVDVVEVTNIAGDGGMDADERVGGRVVESGPVPVGV